MIGTNIQILKYGGAVALAVYSVISNCVILFNSLFTGVGQSVQPVISTNYGAGNWKRIYGIRKMAYLTTSYYLQAILRTKQSFCISILRNLVFPEGRVLERMGIGVLSMVYR